MARTLRLVPLRSIAGSIRAPGDKSISHRALLFGAIADGTSHLIGLGTGHDVATTADVVGRLGIRVERRDDATLLHGRGWTGIERDAADPPLELDCGNSGTTARLLLGLLCGRRGRFRLTGDASLSRRPMERVAGPLRRMGASIDGERLPIEVTGETLRGTEVESDIASAQVKSAMLLAALQAHGPSVVVVPSSSRDHTERMLRAMNAPIEPRADGGWSVGGGVYPLRPLSMTVPGDPSSAAYFAALACVLPGSRVVIEGVSTNPTRLGFFRLLQRMGGDVRWEDDGVRGPEPSGRIVAQSSTLRGIVLNRDDVNDAIDEIPLLAIVATAAHGETIVRGADELRLKESDRISATVELLRGQQVPVTEYPDGLSLAGPVRPAGGSVDASGDHRIAMCAAVAASLAEEPVHLSGHEWVRISHPSFFEDLARISR